MKILKANSRKNRLILELRERIETAEYFNRIYSNTKTNNTERIDQLMSEIKDLKENLQYQHEREVQIIKSLDELRDYKAKYINLLASFETLKK